MRRAELRRECDILAARIATRRAMVGDALQTGQQALSSLLLRPPVLIGLSLLGGLLIGSKRSRQKLAGLRPLLPVLLRFLRGYAAQHFGPAQPEDPPGASGHTDTPH
ncbi:hypothetical protein [Chitinimonas naiadis]